MNPPATLLFEEGRDPWVIRHHGLTYYCRSTGHAIHLQTASTLAGLAAAPDHVIWTAPPSGPCSLNIWAPELHFPMAAATSTLPPMTARTRTTACS